MIFNDKVCFIHAPKTAGMSLTNMLLEQLEKPVYYYVPKGHAMAQNGVVICEGLRHETLAQAEKRLMEKGRSLSEFKIIFSIIRNPYDLEVSRYHYLKLGHSWDKGKAQEIALNENFKSFAEKAPLYGHLPGKFEQFYVVRGSFLSNMKILRFESLDLQIKLQLGEYLPNYSSIPRDNVTSRDKYHKYLDSETEIYIYQKYKWIFDHGFYPREYINNC